MNRRAFMQGGFSAVALGTTARPAGRQAETGQKAAHQGIPKGGRRSIRKEVYGPEDYDAIWYLVNAGFVLRLGGHFIFLDPILMGDDPLYISLRERYIRSEELPVELSHYDPKQAYTQATPFPLLAGEVEKADHVLITHEHADHFDPRSIKAISHLRPRIIASKACHEVLIREGVPRDLLLEARYGSSFDLEVASVQIRYAEHSPGSCGFLLKTKYGNIYHPGDGKFDHPHKEEIGSLEVDYLLLPINDTNLGVGFAALLTQILQPRVVIPCHFGFVNPPIRSQGGHPAEYLTAIAARDYKIPHTDIVVLSFGGRYVLA